MEFIPLGTSAAMPAHGRNLPAYLLRISDRWLLFDCGEGTQFQLQRLNRKISGLQHIFISHFHADHWLGLPGLLSSWELQGRQQDLHIFGPVGLKNLYQDMMALVGFRVRFEVVLHEVPETASTHWYETKYFRLSTFPLQHRIAATGYRIDSITKGRKMKAELIEQYNIPYAAIPDIKAGGDFITTAGITIPNDVLTLDGPEGESFAYCSDTVYLPAIVPHIAGVDLLFHEATFTAADLQQAQQTGHSTATQAANIAKAAAVRQLVIGHFSARYPDTQELTKEAGLVFENSVAAKELKAVVTKK